VARQQRLSSLQLHLWRLQRLLLLLLLLLRHRPSPPHTTSSHSNSIHSKQSKKL